MHLEKACGYLGNADVATISTLLCINLNGPSRGKLKCYDEKLKRFVPGQLLIRAHKYFQTTGARWSETKTAERKIGGKVTPHAKDAAWKAFLQARKVILKNRRRLRGEYKTYRGKTTKKNQKRAEDRKLYQPIEQDNSKAVDMLAEVQKVAVLDASKAERKRIEQEEKEAAERRKVEKVDDRKRKKEADDLEKADKAAKKKRTWLHFECKVDPPTFVYVTAIALNSLPTLRDFIRAQIRGTADVHEIVRGFSPDLDATLQRFMATFVEKMKTYSRQSKSHGKRSESVGDSAYRTLKLSLRDEYTDFIDYATKWDRSHVKLIAR